jgi:hypothetical protein
MNKLNNVLDFWIKQSNRTNERSGVARANELHGLSKRRSSPPSNEKSTALTGEVADSIALETVA